MGQEKSLPDRYCSAPDLKYQNSCHHLNNKKPPLEKTYSESAYFNRRTKKIANDHIVKKSVSPTTSGSGSGSSSSSNSSSSSSSNGGDRLSRSDKLTSPLVTPLRSQPSSSTFCSTCSTPSTTATATTGGSRSSIATSDKSADRQKEYLKQHLYIKSYLDILEEDRKAKKHFKPARPGIRNYKPKILTEKEKTKEKDKENEGELWI